MPPRKKAHKVVRCRWEDAEKHLNELSADYLLLTSNAVQGIGFGAFVELILIFQKLEVAK